MRDIERELRDLGERSRGTSDSARSLSGTSLHRIKLRRFGVTATGALLVAAVAVTGAFAAGGFGSSDGEIEPAQPSATTSPATVVEGLDRLDRCRSPRLVPSYLPEGWAGELQPGRGSGLEAPGVVGHWGNIEEPPAQGDYVDLLVGTSPYHQFGRSQIRVLGGRASMGETSLGRSVEFSHQGCDFTLHTASMGGWEFRRFAEGLRSAGKPLGDEEDQDNKEFTAIWPEDNLQAAEPACEEAAEEDADQEEGGENVVSIRSDPDSVILEFGYEVLGWNRGETFRPRMDVSSERTVFGLRRGDGRGASPRDPQVIVEATEVQPGCWSVASVSRMPDNQPTGFSVSVQGRDLRVGADPLGADSVYIEVSYAGRKMSRAWAVGEEGLGQFRLDFEPDTRGYVLVLFADEKGEVFSAASAHVPPGDFAAG